MTNAIGWCAAVAGMALLLPSMAAAASWTLTARANPERIVGGGSSVIAIRVLADGKPAPSQHVDIEVISGHECGAPASASASTSSDGTITSLLFKANQYVEDCVASIRVTVTPPADAAGAQPAPVVARTSVTVNPSGSASARIDGISAIALIVLVSFSIDRLLRGLFFLLSYWSVWAARFPDPELDGSPASAMAERDRKFVYFGLAALLGIGAIGGFGRVRLLAALGFTDVNPWLDILVTGLILMGGADRTEQFLRGLGASGPKPSAPAATPIQITGRLILDDQGKKALGVDKTTS